MKANVKKTLAGAILSISFLPYLAVFIQGCCAYKNGNYLWSGEAVGFEAAYHDMQVLTLLLTAVGVIPVCLAIQMTFLVHRKAVKLGLPEKKIKTLTAVHLVGFLIAAALNSVLTMGCIFR